MIPKKGKVYDFDKLNSVMERIKRRYEESDTVMVVPSKETKYQEMIETMDAARSMKVTIKGKERKIPLFPVVVVSSLVE
jgi:biopolymer transport protein ExbD